MRLISGGRDFDRFAASESQMGRFETRTLTSMRNLNGIDGTSSQWIDRVRPLCKGSNLILAIDSSNSPVHGSREGAAWNGHLGCTRHHPLFASSTGMATLSGARFAPALFKAPMTGGPCLIP